MHDTWTELQEACRAPVTRLQVAGRAGFLLEPLRHAAGRPWLFYAPTLEGTYPTVRQAWIFSRLLSQGIAVTGVDVGESYGNPFGRACFDAWYEHLTRTRSYARRASLLPQSRGGLMLYNWAADHPEKVAGITGIYTVCDIHSYPGLEKAAEAYGLSQNELENRLADHNPVDRLALLASRRIPIWHIHGDSDSVVPLEANAGELVRRYRSLGGSADLLVVPGYGHEEHALYFERPEVVTAAARQAFSGASDREKR